MPEGVGAYSESQGFAIVRQQVADFIAERDGVPGPAIEECVKSVGAVPVMVQTQCFV